MNAKSIKILIGGDSDTFDYRCVTALQALGFSAYTCPRNGQLVWDAISQLQPNAVIVEAAMPYYDAITLLEKFQACEHRPAFLVTCTCKNPYVKQQVLQFQNTAFLEQPFSPEQLTSHIQMLLTNRSEVRTTANHMATGELTYAITDILHQLGIPAHLKGYHYLRSSLLAVCQDTFRLTSMRQNLYPMIASSYHTTAACVERGIRHAVQTAWERCSSDTMTELLGDSASSFLARPTNAVLISALADQLNLTYAY